MTVIVGRSGIHMTTTPCPRCTALGAEGKIRTETILPLPAGAHASQARDGSGPQCQDCAAAETLVSMKFGMDFGMARIAVGNDRQENLRLPDRYRQHFGLVKQRLMRTAIGDDALQLHWAWLDRYLPWWRIGSKPESLTCVRCGLAFRTDNFESGTQRLRVVTDGDTVGFLYLDGIKFTCQRCDWLSEVE